MTSDIDAKVRRMMADMPGAFNAANAEGVNATILYHLTGDGGSAWLSSISTAGCTVEEVTLTGDANEDPDATLTINMDAQDYVDMMAGRLDAMQAFMMGKIKVQGDIMLATRLMTFFR